MSIFDIKNYLLLTNKFLSGKGKNINDKMDKLEIQRINELYTETLPFILSDETYSFLQKLPEKQRLCFILRHIYDYSYKQIADTLGTSVSYVSVLLVRSRSLIVVK